jgi:membrane-anchored protein YejM (alkaline phosphatase superfamily)
MKAASVNEIKKAIQALDEKEVQDFCLRLAKFKKENKELLTYLLFEAQDEHAYVESVKEEMDELFNTVPRSNVYLIKKVLRKILRIVNKQIRYSGISESEVTLRIHFCMKMKKSGIQLQSSAVISNLYNQQLKKINAALSKLDEDLQFDYARDFEYISR